MRAAFIDALLADLDTELVGSVRRACPVVVVDPVGTAARWETAGASVLANLPADESSLFAAVQAAESSTQCWPPRDEPTPDGADLLAVIAAPGGDGTAVAAAIARSLVATGIRPGPVVLADLTLDAPHRSLHGLTPDRPGLPELIEAGRFGPPPPALARRAQHPTGQGYLLVPGLLRHQDWVTVGDRSAPSALDALRSSSALLIAHVDHDLEGEAETGSADIEDRNVLARTGVRTADLVVVASGSDRAGRLGVIVTLGALARFGVPHDRTVVVRPGGRWSRRRASRRPTSSQILLLAGSERPDARVGTAIRARLAASGPRTAPGSIAEPDPQPIVPGTLGHWAQDVDGWITPRVPQQP